MANIVNKIWEALGMGQKQGEEIDEEELDSGRRRNQRFIWKKSQCKEFTNGIKWKPGKNGYYSTN